MTCLHHRHEKKLQPYKEKVRKVFEELLNEDSEDIEGLRNIIDWLCERMNLKNCEQGIEKEVDIYMIKMTDRFPMDEETTAAMTIEKLIENTAEQLRLKNGGKPYVGEEKTDE